MTVTLQSIGARAAILWCLLASVADVHAQPPPPDAPVPARTRMVRVPAFGAVTVYEPAGTPQHVVLFLSGAGGWNQGVIPMAERLRDQGALVAGIDIRAFLESLEASSSCAYPTGNLEELSRSLQQMLKMPSYRRPIIVGYSSGATMAYAAVAAAPRDTLAGAISLGFCPDVQIRVPLCHMRGLKASKRASGTGYDLAPYPDSAVPWMVLQGQQDQVCAPAQTERFVRSTGAARLFSLPKVGHGFGVTANWEPAFLEAYREVAKASTAADVPRAATAAVADLSLVEVPAEGTRYPDTMAIVLSGDGGWAELDKAVAQGLAAAGIPVVGWSSLDYYWSPRTPERASADLARIVEHYTAAWKRPQVIVVGYSFGADVAPFLVNRLPTAARRHTTALVLLAPSGTASFEFHVAGWLGMTAGATLATRPEIARLAVPTLCVVPADEDGSVCPAGNPRVQSVPALAGHHFGGDYPGLVRTILRAIDAAHARVRGVADVDMASVRTRAPAGDGTATPMRACGRSAR